MRRPRAAEVPFLIVHNFLDPKILVIQLDNFSRNSGLIATLCIPSAGQTNEEFDPHVPDDIVLEDEVILHEELQIILPPRCDDVTAESSTTTTTDNNSTS